MLESRMRMIFIAAVNLLLTVGVASGQIGGGLGENTRTDLGGNNYIAGFVYAPDGRPITVRTRVTLVSMTAGEVSAFTDARGQFIFSGVGSGDYVVKIDREKDYEPIAESVYVVRARSTPPETYSVSLRLVAKRPATVKPGVLYAEDAKATQRSIALFREAMSLGKAKDHRGAIEKLEAAITESPNFISALNELGVQYMLIGRLAEAEAPLRKALEINDGADEPLTNLSILLFRLQRYAEAEKTAQKLISENGRSAVGYFYLGRSQIGTDRRDEAAKNLLKAVELGGSQFREAHLLVATMYHEKGDTRRALTQLEAYLKTTPEAADAERVKLAIKKIRGS